MVQKIGIIFKITPLLLLEWDNKRPKLVTHELSNFHYWLPSEETIITSIRFIIIIIQTSQVFSLNKKCFFATLHYLSQLVREG